MRPSPTTRSFTEPPPGDFHQPRPLTLGRTMKPCLTPPRPEEISHGPASMRRLEEALTWSLPLKPRPNTFSTGSPRPSRFTKEHPQTSCGTRPSPGLNAPAQDFGGRTSFALTVRLANRLFARCQSRWPVRLGSHSTTCSPTNCRLEEVNQCLETRRSLMDPHP